MSTQLTVLFRSAADAWADWMWPMTWHVTVLVLVVAALGWLLRSRSARLRYALWLLVLIRLLVPPTLALATGWGWWLLPATEATAPPAAALAVRIAPDRPPAIQERSQPGPARSAAVEPKAVDGPVPPQTDPAFVDRDSPQPNLSATDPMATDPMAAVLVSAVTPPGWLAWLFCGWLLGVVVLAFRLLVGCVCATSMVRRAKQLSAADRPGATELLDDCRRRMGIRRAVRLRQLADASVPMLIGFVRPTIILPVGLSTQLTGSELEAVLVHELQHVARYDAIVHLGQSLLGIVYFFHPCVWLTNRLLNGLREDACDEATVAVLEGQRRDYGAGIVKVAQLMSGPMPSMSLGIVESGSQVKRRLRRILDPRLPTGRRLSWSAVALLLVLAVVLLPVAARPGQSASQEPAKPTAVSSDADMPQAVEALSPPGAAAAVESDPPATPKPGGVLKADRPAEATTTGSMRITVVDQAGQAIPRAKIFVNSLPLPNRDYVCDSGGQIDVEIPKKLSLLRIWASSDGYVPLFAQWWPAKQEDGLLVPTEFTYRMQTGTVIGGAVNDDQGRPIAGVLVEVEYNGDGYKTEISQRPVFNTWLSQGSDAITTDAKGRWMLDNVPPGDDVKLSIKLTHPDYICDMSWGDTQKKQHVTIKSLRAKAASMVMYRGTAITGRLSDPDGKPVSGAVVVWGDRPYWEHRPQQEVRSDENGLYRFPPLPSGPMTVTVMAPGWMPELRVIEIAPDLPPQDFRLKPGKTLRLRFVDSSGNPVPDVSVSIQRWRGKESLYNHQHSNVLETSIPVRTVDGVYEWAWAPDDAVTYQTYAREKGQRLASKEVTLTADDQEHVLVFQNLLHITGHVTDAQTGRPINDFNVVPVLQFNESLSHVDREEAKGFSQGDFALDLDRTDTSYRLRIEAPGYRVAMGDAYRVGQPDPTCDFRLEPAPPAGGRVVDARGQPVAGAKVFLATSSQQLRLDDHKDETPDNQAVVSDANGAFSFPAQFERYTVVAIHQDGYAEVAFEPNQLPGDLKLAAWARVAGRVIQAGGPVAGAIVNLRPLRPRIGDYSRIEDQFSRTTDETGRFVFERVPPVKIALMPWLTPWEEYPITSAESVPLELQPGEKVDLDLGGNGPQVRGRVVLKGSAAQDIDLHYSLNWLVRIAPGIEPPAVLARQGFDWRRGWNEVLECTTEGTAFRDTLHHYFVKLASDGTFLISGVPAGQYDLAFKIYERPEGCLVDPVGAKVLRFRVTESDVAKGTVDLGAVEIDAELGPKPGELVPDFAFELLDGGRQKLSQLRGQYVLFDVWASWCKPCIASLPEVHQLHDEYHAGGRLVLVGLSLDADKAAARAFAQQQAMPWTQGFAGESANANLPTRWGIGSIPAYVLIDPAGKLVDKFYSADKAKQQIDSILDPPAPAP